MKLSLDKYVSAPAEPIPDGVLEQLKGDPALRGAEFREEDHPRDSAGRFSDGYDSVDDPAVDPDFNKHGGQHRRRNYGEEGLREVFHGTHTEALSAIEEEGLVPSAGKGNDAWFLAKNEASVDEMSGHDEALIGDRKASVYFTTLLYDAEQYAAQAAEMNPRSQPVILKCLVPERALQTDEASGAYRVRGGIDPDFIEEYAILEKYSDREWAPPRFRKFVAAATEGGRVIYVVFLVEQGGAPRGAEFDPNQPRDEAGRWTDSGAGADLPVNKAGVEWNQRVNEAGRPIPIKVGNVEEGAKLLLQGKVIEVEDVATVHTIVDRLAGMAKEAEALGQKAPNYDLCNVSVRGTNLFCVDNLGVDRIKMPQLGGQPVPGSEADKLPRNPWDPSEVDGADVFMKHMEALGIRVDEGRVQASSLKASQRELVGPKVASMMLNDKFDPGRNPIFVSRDGYVVDGHHRWAAVVGRDAKNGALGDEMGGMISVRRVDAPISEVLRLALAWSTKFGIKQYAGVKGARGLAEWREEDHPRDERGRFSEVPVDAGFAPEGSGGGGAMNGLDTQQIHLTENAEGKLDYTPQRRAKQDEWIRAVRGDHAPAAPGQSQAFLVFGGPSTSKSSMLRTADEKNGDPEGILFKEVSGLDAAVADPDAIKYEMPEFARLRDAGNPAAAMYVHEESSDVSKRAAAEFLADGLNIVVDKVGGGDYGKFRKQAETMRAQGAGRLVANFVTVDTEAAWDRATRRAFNPNSESYGRILDPDFFAAAHRSVSANFVRSVADGIFDEFRLFDNNGSKAAGPRLIASGRGKQITIFDRDAYMKFVAKANENINLPPMLSKMPADFYSGLRKLLGALRTFGIVEGEEKGGGDGRESARRADSNADDGADGSGPEAGAARPAGAASGHAGRGRLPREVQGVPRGRQGQAAGLLRRRGRVTPRGAYSEDQPRDEAGRWTDGTPKSDILFGGGKPAAEGAPPPAGPAPSFRSYPGTGRPIGGGIQDEHRYGNQLVAENFKGAREFIGSQAGDETRAASVARLYGQAVDKLDPAFAAAAAGVKAVDSDYGEAPFEAAYDPLTDTLMLADNWANRNVGDRVGIVLHELGHRYAFGAGRDSFERFSSSGLATEPAMRYLMPGTLKSALNPNGYTPKNYPQEVFAESFSWYHMRPQMLEGRLPKLYEFWNARASNKIESPYGKFQQRPRAAADQGERPGRVSRRPDFIFDDSEEAAAMAEQLLRTKSDLTPEQERRLRAIIANARARGAEFKEEDHPRDQDGKFTDSGSGGSGSAAGAGVAKKAAESLRSIIGSTGEGRPRPVREDDWSPGGFAFDVRDWGRWEHSWDRRNEEDDDHMVLSDASRKKLEGIVQKFAAENPSIKVDWMAGEKNYIDFFISPKTSARGAEYDEGKHPRDERGRWTDGEGGPAAAPNTPQAKVDRENWPKVVNAATSVMNTPGASFAFNAHAHAVPESGFIVRSPSQLDHSEDAGQFDPLLSPYFMARDAVARSGMHGELPENAFVQVSCSADGGKLFLNIARHFSNKIEAAAFANQRGVKTMLSLDKKKVLPAKDEGARGAAAADEEFRTALVRVDADGELDLGELIAAFEAVTGKALSEAERARVEAAWSEGEPRGAADWDESQHPRAQDGKFTDGSGGDAAPNDGLGPSPYKGGGVGERVDPYASRARPGAAPSQSEVESGARNSSRSTVPDNEIGRVIGDYHEELRAEGFRVSKHDVYKVHGRPGERWEWEHKDGARAVVERSKNKGGNRGWAASKIYTKGVAKNLAAASGGCGCTKTGEGRRAQSQEGERSMSEKLNALVDRMIGCTRSPFVEADRAVLAAFGEDRLTEMVGKLDAPPATEPPKVLSEEEWLAAAPAALRSIVEERRAEEAKTRKATIESLAKEQKEFTPEQLESKPTSELQALARMLAARSESPATDFSGRGETGVTAPKPPESTPTALPDPYDLAGLAAKRQAGARQEAN